MIGKAFLHFCRRLEPRFAGGDFGRSDGRQQPSRADRVHRAVMQVRLRLKEVHVVRRHQRHAEFMPDALGLAQRSSIARRQVLHLDVQTIAENIF